MRNYFCGWYYRCQSDQQTLAVIPSIHRTEDSDFCTIQLITDTGAFYVQFPNIRFPCGRSSQIWPIHAAEIRHHGSVSVCSADAIPPHRLQYAAQSRWDTIGQRCALCIPECHRLFGGRPGRSFPKEYIWTYCSVPNGAVMLSVADIPFGCFHFTGVIGVVLLDGKEYRLATYLGAKAIKIQPDEIAIQQGMLCLTVRRSAAQGHPLCASISGAMTRTIHEHPSCEVHYRFEEDGSRLLDYNATNAAFEYEY